MPNNVQNVQVSDTTNDDRSHTAHNKINIHLLSILLRREVFLYVISQIFDHSC